jgi:hypothetical protein
MDRIQNVKGFSAERHVILKVAHDNDKQKLLGYDMVLFLIAYRFLISKMCMFCKFGVKFQPLKIIQRKKIVTFF